MNKYASDDRPQKGRIYRIKARGFDLGKTNYTYCLSDAVRFVHDRLSGHVTGLDKILREMLVLSQRHNDFDDGAKPIQIGRPHKFHTDDNKTTITITRES